MSANKMGSKLAQGVRQVMGKQDIAPEVAKKTVAQPVAASKAQPASATRASLPQVTNNTQSEQPVYSGKILHPSRVWPD